MNCKTILHIGRCFFLGIMCCLIFSSGVVAVTLPDGMVVSYTHDALTRPVAKGIDGTIVEKYLWNGRTQLLAVLEADNSVRQRFVYADDRLPYAMTQGGATYYLAYDQVGSLRLVTNASGAVVKEVVYDTFGNIISDSNPSFGVPFGFAGGLHDQETGLVRFGYRDYSPEIGRWTAKDPIGFAGGDTNLYGYVFSDPVNFVDPEGLRIQGSRLANAISGAIYGGLSGGMGGYLTGGRQGARSGALVGALIGGLLGYISPNASAGGTGLGSGAANLLGQLLGNLSAGKDWRDPCNYDFGAAAGAALGGAYAGGFSALVTNGRTGLTLAMLKGLSIPKEAALVAAGEHLGSRR